MEKPTYVKNILLICAQSKKKKCGNRTQVQGRNIRCSRVHPQRSVWPIVIFCFVYTAALLVTENAVRVECVDSNRHSNSIDGQIKK